MCMSDTAEYWFDIKNKKPYYGPNFYHIPGHNCGHLHYYEAIYIDEVNCHSCKRALKKGIVHILKTEEEHRIHDLRKEKSKLESLKQKSKNKYPDNPVCKCGFVMVERKNSKTNTKFFGCYNYPSCKNTK